MDVDIISLINQLSGKQFTAPTVISYVLSPGVVVPLLATAMLRVREWACIRTSGTRWSWAASALSTGQMGFCEVSADHFDNNLSGAGGLADFHPGLQ
jgi:hypothetical protein